MGVKYLHELLENGVVPNSVIPVDLIKLAKFGANKNTNVLKKPSTGQKLCLVVDGECCLNRLYGGYYADWVCGGQWNRMVGFLDKLVSLLENSSIELIVFFNGAIETQRMNEWITQQKEEYKKITQIFSHLNRKGTPPPQAWWIAPIGLRMAIRMMLRQKNVNVVCTIDDHRQEVIAYCRENKFHGLIAEDAEYIAFDPPRLFSASNLKLTYRGTLETKEYMISELMKDLDLTNEKLCVLAALLGNYLLPDKDLKDIYKAANIDVLIESTAETMVKKLAKYLNNINLASDLDEIGRQILGSDNDSRGPLLKQSIQYYLDGTKDGFLKFRSVSSGKRGKNIESSDVESADIYQESDLDTSILASENIANDKNLLTTYKETTSCLNNGQDDSKTECSDTSNSTLNVNCDSSSSEQSGSLKKTKIKKDKPNPVLPPVPHEVMQTVSDRHSKGLMSPYIYQILSQGEIKLPVVLEDGKAEIPNIYLFYKPIRQMVYAIVFNLHHHRYMALKNNTPLDIDIRIKEWIYNKTTQTHKIEYVKAEPVGWRVPTIQRLWFGTTQDDKRRRLRAFLTCMRSDVQLLLNPDFVPQQLLVAAVVLRYMMSFPDKKVLRKAELDAFIVAALTPEFGNTKFTDEELKLTQLSSRAVQLAAMFMKGIEMAMLVNDACGAPVPWMMCCPWLFFDGKLFHSMYTKATSAKNLQEFCGNRLGLAMHAERMRQAILEGLNVQFARPPIPNVGNEELKAYQRPLYLNHVRMPPSLPPVSSSNVNRPMPMGAGRGRRSQGGRLEIAGVVVGSWGANYNLSQQSYESPYLLPPQHVAAVGNYNSFPGYRPRTGFIPRPKGRAFKSLMDDKKKPIRKEKKGKGRGMSISGVTSAGSTLPVEISSDSKQNGENKSTDSNLTNGVDDMNSSDGQYKDAVLNGAIGFMGEGDGPKTIKTIRDASSSLVGAVLK